MLDSCVLWFIQIFKCPLPDTTPIANMNNLLNKETVEVDVCVVGGGMA